MNLGEAIKRAREANALTLRDLEEAAGVHYSTIAKIERGAIREPHFRIIARIAKALDLSLDQLAKCD